MAKKTSYLKKKQTFSGAQVLLFVLIFASVGAVAIWQSLAAPHNGGGGKPTGGTSTLTGPVMVGDLNSDGLANHGDTIDFTVSTTATSVPQVGLRCYQGSNFIYDAYKSFYGSDPAFTSPFKLESGYWQSGTAANCTARLFYNDKKGHQVVLTTLSFVVNP